MTVGLSSVIIHRHRLHDHRLMITDQTREARQSHGLIIQIITARVRSTTGRYCFHRCLSVHRGGGPDLGTPPPPGGGVPRSGYPPGGYPGQVTPPGGVPRSGYPPGGYPDLGTPWGGTRVRYPPGGVPGSGTPPPPPPGGTRVRYPPGGGVPGSGTPRGGVPG